MPTIASHCHSDAGASRCADTCRSIDSFYDLHIQCATCSFATSKVHWFQGPDSPRHCPKVYLKTCYKIILWQKLRCHKMILRHTLRQFTKFVLRDLTYSQDMTRCHSNYDVRLFRFRICIWHMYPFYPFVTEPARTRTSIHSTKRTALPQYGH